jgi:hypothetical protein
MDHRYRPTFKAWSPYEAEQFLAAVHGDRWYGLYAAALSLGLRRGEALGLRWRLKSRPGKDRWFRSCRPGPWTAAVGPSAASRSTGP